jgi:antitoxin MazE
MPIKTGLIRIGNSRGIRLPKPLIDEHGFSDVVELHSRSDGVLIKQAKRQPREGWEEMAKAMAVAGDDELLIPDTIVNEWDRTEWTWPDIPAASKSTSSRSTRRKGRK